MRKVVTKYLCVLCAIGGFIETALPAPKMAFQIYGVRELAAKDFRGTLKAAAAIGYKGVETGRFYGFTAKELKNACGEAGLEIVALQLYPYNLTEPQLAETIRFCKECGCKRINTAWYKGSEENVNDWQLMVNVLNHAAEVCAKEGIKVAYHNHDHEFSMKRGEKTIWEWLWTKHPPKIDDKQVAQMVPFSEKVGIEFDPANAAKGGADALHVVAKALPRKSECMHVTLETPLDWKAVIAAASPEWLVVKPATGADSTAELKRQFEVLAGAFK